MYEWLVVFDSSKETVLNSNTIAGVMEQLSRSYIQGERQEDVISIIRINEVITLSFTTDGCPF